MMKRFYKDVTSVNGQILLDGKSVKTPGKQTLNCPNEKIVELCINEWQAQEVEIKPETMPVTQILITAQDVVSANREGVKTQILNYINTDLICYFAGENDPTGTHIRAQKQAWTPWITWFENEAKYEVQTTTALTALEQDKNIKHYVSDILNKFDLIELTCFHILTQLSGSVILSLAFFKGVLNGSKFFDLVHLDTLVKDDLYNADFYGRDPVFEKKAVQEKKDIDAISRILQSL